MEELKATVARWLEMTSDCSVVWAQSMGWHLLTCRLCRLRIQARCRSAPARHMAWVPGMNRLASSATPFLQRHCSILYQRSMSRLIPTTISATRRAVSSRESRVFSGLWMQSSASYWQPLERASTVWKSSYGNRSMMLSHFRTVSFTATILIWRQILTVKKAVYGHSTISSTTASWSALSSSHAVQPVSSTDRVRNSMILASAASSII